MKELLNTLLEDKRDRRDIFKPHGEEGIEKLKQEWSKLSGSKQVEALRQVLVSMEPNALMKLANDSGFEIVSWVITGLYKEATQDRAFREELYFDALTRERMT